MSTRLPMCSSARIALLLSLLAGSAGATSGTTTVNPDGTVTVTYTNDMLTPIPDGDLDRGKGGRRFVVASEQKRGEPSAKLGAAATVQAGVRRARHRDG
jgi:hypothetical protein